MSTEIYIQQNCKIKSNIKIKKDKDKTANYV